MKYLIAKILFMLLIIPSFAQNEQLNSEWVDEDKMIFKNLMTTIHSNDNQVQSYLEELQNLDIRENRNLGFNEHHYSCAQYGGYITFWISINVVNNQVYNLEILMEPEDAKYIDQVANHDPYISKELKDHWIKENFANTDHEVYIYKHFDDSIFNNLILNIENKLGKLEVEVDNKYEMQYDILTSPRSSYDFGESCYYSGNEPVGRVAINELINAKQTEVIRKAIRGFNPEGRIYAIEALLKLSSEKKCRITEEDKKVINLVLNLNVKINRCKGCFVSSILGKELFLEEEFAKLLTLNGISLE